MPRRLLINEQPSFASIGYSHQQLSRVPRGTANRHSQFHCPKSKMSKGWFVLEQHNNRDWGPYLNLVLDVLLLNNLFYLEINVRYGPHLTQLRRATRFRDRRVMSAPSTIGASLAHRVL